jgi:transcription-repair coupling factor (superfamily II helicase)
MPASIPAAYVTDKIMRLRLYRRMADLRRLEEVDSLEEEFKDRFGELPEAVTNLLYQIKVKLLAERAGLASVSSENGQLVLRYPENVMPESLPDLGPNVRVGKTALWLPYAGLDNWPEVLMETLQTLEELQGIREKG